ncbi:hypothetical protein CFP65_6751 [Kitasatospora sp. MMS16-BH015]|uniref:hypothetical protein n=1 Tax=Kitasatospora sp. MMS16-BH015 TaxID=2018025 RepID=UPI000CA11512|nr:hypothetical protein [Kitasatospora sp. MMS16-BH015]AUG81391.1 hypothetical protein CFP65_6751 [Kitasatospora sp. MMS16-BH015]
MSEVYLFDEAESTPVRADDGVADFPEGLVAAVEAVCFQGRLVWGADLAPLLERYGVALISPELAGAGRDVGETGLRSACTAG